MFNILDDEKLEKIEPVKEENAENQIAKSPKEEDKTAKIDTQADTATTKKLQLSSEKTLKLQAKNLRLLDKQKVLDERAKMKEQLANLTNELIRAKQNRQRKIEDIRHEILRMRETENHENEKNKALLRDSQNVLIMKKRDIAILEKSHRQENLIQKNKLDAHKRTIISEITKKSRDVKKEVEAKKRELKAQAMKDRAAAAEIKAKLRQEVAQSKAKHREEKLEYKKKLMDMKLALFAEKNQQKEEVMARKQSLKRKAAEQLAIINQERTQIIKERNDLKANMSMSRIEARIKAEMEAKKRKSLEESLQAEADAQKLKNETELTIIKQDNSFQLAEDRTKANEIAQEKLHINIDDEDIQQIVTEDVISEYEDKIEVEEFTSHLINYVKVFHGFEKKGTHLLKAIERKVSDKVLQKFERNTYYAPLVKNYKFITEQEDFVSFEDIVFAAYAMVETEHLNTTLITEKIITIRKALLQSIGVKIGRYYILPVHKNAISSFIITANIKIQEYIFDERELFKFEVIEAIEEIVDYKLSKGGSIKVIEGLLIDNHEGDLQIALYPNIFNR